MKSLTARVTIRMDWFEFKFRSHDTPPPLAGVVDVDLARAARCAPRLPRVRGQGFARTEERELVERDLGRALKTSREPI